MRTETRAQSAQRTTKNLCFRVHVTAINFHCSLIHYRLENRSHLQLNARQKTHRFRLTIVTFIYGTHATWRGGMVSGGEHCVAGFWLVIVYDRPRRFERSHTFFALALYYMICSGHVLHFSTYKMKFTHTSEPFFNLNWLWKLTDDHLASSFESTRCGRTRNAAISFLHYQIEPEH